ncbi:MAG: leucine-rich repeat domain-containing protein [Clostridia bacterium]|nr:leucine-rich repeat domain-containing protein [Clostridia bacterium]
MSDKDLVIINNKVMCYRGNDENIVVPQGVTCIREDAFYNCVSIESVTLPETVTEIGVLAFCNCTNLKEINLPNKVKTINYSCFNGCFSLEKVVLPYDLRLICLNAFTDCKRLKHIILPENITSFKFSSLKVIWDYFTGTEHAVAIKCSFLKQYFHFVKEETELKRKIKVSKKNIVKFAIELDDAEIVKNLFSLYKKIQLDELDAFINDADKSVSVLSFLLEYKNSKYSVADQEYFWATETEKMLGIKERNISDWKKIFGFYTKNSTAVITKYKSLESVVEVPEKIGKYVVTGISEKAFSAYAQRLTDKEKISRKKLEHITLPVTINKIAEDAFLGCTLLTFHSEGNGYIEQYAKKHNIPIEK